MATTAGDQFDDQREINARSEISNDSNPKPFEPLTPPQSPALASSVRFDISIRQITSVEDPAQAGFIAAYQEAFSRFPYDENYEYSEVLEKVWMAHVEHCLLVAEYGSKVIGFACAHPVVGPAVSRQASEYIVTHAEGFDPENSIYVSELGVLQGTERKGVGSQLVLALYQWGLNNGFEFFTTRTAGEGSNSLKVFERLWGKRFGEVQLIEAGEHEKPTASNSRVYLWGNLVETLRNAELQSSLPAVLFDKATVLEDCYPGGNDTYIAHSDGICREAYAIADRLIKHRWSKFEQGAFLEPSSTGLAIARMQMAGGEFCGNATRSMGALLASDYWAGNYQRFGSSVRYDLLRQIGPDTITFPLEVSGTTRILNIMVTKDSHGGYRVRTEMPSAPSFAGISEVDLNIEGQPCAAQLVRMDGICHILIRESDLAFLNEADSYSQRMANAIRDLGLNNEPAVGMIFYKEEAGRLRINPIVFVKAVNSCFYESACGSGTLALAQSIAKQSQQADFVVSIVQPSGFAIDARVESEPSSGAILSASIEGVVTLRGNLNNPQ